MNKTKIAVGVVVALGVVWTGAAWLTGKQIESHMDQIVQNANAQLTKLAPDSRLKVSYQNYQRGLFTSHTQLVVQASSQTEDNALLKPGQSVVLNETIDHGPFPFAQLKNFNLIPSMASVHSELENTPALKKLFELTKGKSVIDADTRIGYSGATASTIRLLPLDYQNSETGERYAWNGGTLGIDSDAEGDRVNFDSDIDSVALTIRNEANQPVLFTLNGISLNGKTHLSPQGVRIGDQHFNLKKLTTAVNGQETATLEGMDIKTQFDSSGNTLSGQMDYAIDNLMLEKQSFGSGKMTLKLSQFDGQALKTASDNYRSQMQALINQPGIEQDPERYQEGVRQIMAANLPLLLKGDPVVTVAPLSWKNDKGESTFNLAAHFKDPATAQGVAQTPADALSRMLKSLEGKLVINMPMATALMKQVAMAEGYQESDASKLAEQQIKGLAAMGQMFRLTQQQDDNIVTSLQFNGTQVTMNGENMPLDGFLSRYMLGAPAQNLPE
ncbi:YdgA family protein [Pantoea sp. FN0305]|uniref:YdgA family protein n=1 Tax=Pantoea sp. FN0305 TaxID=3418559 RepID=UPI003CEEACA7